MFAGILVLQMAWHLARLSPTSSKWIPRPLISGEILCLHHVCLPKDFIAGQHLHKNDTKAPAFRKSYPLYIIVRMLAYFIVKSIFDTNGLLELITCSFNFYLLYYKRTIKKHQLTYKKFKFLLYACHAWKAYTYATICCYVYPKRIAQLHV